MHEHKMHRARLISSVAATVISLACGTNYVYSAWAPQFADRLQLSTTQANLIGLSGNLGMYSLGVPVGVFIDAKGPRPAVVVGALLLGCGYFPLRQAYDAGAGSVPLLCIFSYMTGLGGCTAFASAIKTSALNWPHHRGTATAFPLAAFGLSAFFFSLCGSVLVPGNTGGFLLLLAIGTSVMTLAGFFFLRVLPHGRAAYQAVAAGDADVDIEHNSDLTSSQQLRRTISAEAKVRAAPGGRGQPYQDLQEPGTSHVGELAGTEDAVIGEAAGNNAGQYHDNGGGGSGGSSSKGDSAAFRSQYAAIGAASSSTPLPDVLTAAATSSSSTASATAEDAAQESMDETSSLVSKASSLPGDVLVQSSVDIDRSHRIDIRGWALMSSLEFWQLFAIMGILAGIGLMTINNIGHDVNALWKHFDASVDDSFLVARQQMHVSILSLGSFSGRLLSGVGSDFLVKVLRASRVWCLVIAASIFVVAQLCALGVTNPHYLGLVSGLSGLGYGFLFGVFPSIVAEAFGIHALSQNWGFMTLSPVMSGNIFNLFYGSVFDGHTIVGPDGSRTCSDGIECYRAAYLVTLGACGVGLAVTLLVIRHQYLERVREAGKRNLED